MTGKMSVLIKNEPLFALYNYSLIYAFTIGPDDFPYYDEYLTTFNYKYGYFPILPSCWFYDAMYRLLMAYKRLSLLDKTMRYHIH